MMKMEKPWANDLGVSPEQISSWSGEVPKGASLTFWCMENNKITTDDYLIWARDYYGTAVLKKEFFELPPNYEIWGQIASVANWSQEMIPVAEWDGVIFIACVEPQTEVSWSFPVRFLIADATDLKTYWQKLQNPVAVAPNAKSALGTAPTPATDDGGPMGIQINLAAPSRKEFDPMADLQKQLAGAGKDIDLSIPENMSWKPKQDSMSANTPDGLSIPVISEQLPPVPTSLAAANNEPVTPVAPAMNVETPVPAMPAMAAEPAPPLNLGMLGGPSQSPPQGKIASSNSQVDVDPQTVVTTVGFTGVFKEDFRGGMILEMRVDMVVPIVWDDLFKSPSTGTFPVPLTGPSAFKVVQRSKKPYLGHVVETEINTTFFKAYGFSEMPKMVLIQPFMTGDKVTHLLLCVCDPDKKNQDLLAAGEKLSKLFNDHLSKQSSAA